MVSELEQLSRMKIRGSSAMSDDCSSSSSRMVTWTHRFGLVRTGFGKEVHFLMRLEGR